MWKLKWTEKVSTWDFVVEKRERNNHKASEPSVQHCNWSNAQKNNDKRLTPCNVPWNYEKMVQNNNMDIDRSWNLGRRKLWRTSASVLGYDEQPTWQLVQAKASKPTDRKADSHQQNDEREIWDKVATKLRNKRGSNLGFAHFFMWCSWNKIECNAKPRTSWKTVEVWKSSRRTK